MPGKRISEDQKRQITAALFRREPYPQISEAHGIHLTTVKRIANSLSTYGTFAPPRDETKPMGRPRLVTPELLEVCRSVFILSNVDGDSRREGRGSVHMMDCMAFKKTTNFLRKGTKDEKANNINTPRHSAPTLKNTQSRPWENSHPSFP